MRYWSPMHTSSSLSPSDREVLPELAEDEVVALQLVAPVAVRVELIDVHRALLAPVPGAIALAVAVDVQSVGPGADPAPASFQIPVKTVRPCQLTSRGIPTLTDTSLATRPDIRTEHLPGGDLGTHSRAPG